MSDQNLVLFAASYPDETSAVFDFRAFRDAQNIDDFELHESAVMIRDTDGEITTRQDTPNEGTKAVAGGAIAGLLVGLFAGPLVAATAVGGLLGGVVQQLAETYDEKKISEDVEAILPKNSAAIMAIMHAEDVEKGSKALTRSLRTMVRPIRSEDYDTIRKALEKAGLGQDDKNS